MMSSLSLCWCLFTCTILLNFPGIHAIYKQSVNGITFENVTEFAPHAMDTEIQHMEMDLRNDNFVLFSSGTMMFTMDLESNVKFQLTDIHNQNNINLTFLSSFSQKNRNQVLLVDRDSHCIHHLERNTNTTQPFIGKCNDKGCIDGTFGSARFDYPSMVLGNPDGSAFYLTENYHIRRIDFQDLHTDSVSTELTHTHHTIFAIAIDFETGTGYYSTEYRLQIFNLASSKLTITELNRSDQKGHTDGSLTTAKFDHPLRLVLLNKDTLLVVEQNSRTYRVVNIKSREVSSLGQMSIPKDGHDGDIDQCLVQKPTSLLVVPMLSKVLVGEKGRICQLRYSVTYCEQLVLLGRQFVHTLHNWTICISAWNLLRLVGSLMIAYLGRRLYTYCLNRSLDVRPNQATIRPEEESATLRNGNRQPAIALPTDAEY